MADDTDEFKCALNLVPASGGEIYMPAGRYKLTDTLAVLNKNITFRGDGQRLTNLEWYSPTYGFKGVDFLSNTGPVHHTLNVRSLSLLRADGPGGVGIYAVWRPTSSSPLEYGGTSATLFDVHISTTSTPSFWSHGVYFANAVGARIHSFNIDSKGTWYDGSSILIDGKSIDVTISDGNMGRADRGVTVTGQSESVRVENVETSQNTVGYFFQTGKHHSITNCHAGVVDYGIQFNDSSDAVIAGNFLLLVRIGIVIWNPALPGARFQVRDNLLVAHNENIGPHDSHVIEIAGAVTDAIVMGNQLKSATPPDDPHNPQLSSLKTIHLDAGVSNTLVTANYLRGYLVVKDNPNNVVANNY